MAATQEDFLNRYLSKNRVSTPEKPTGAEDFLNRYLEKNVPSGPSYMEKLGLNWSGTPTAKTPGATGSWDAAPEPASLMPQPQAPADVTAPPMSRITTEIPRDLLNPGALDILMPGAVTDVKRRQVFPVKGRGGHTILNRQEEITTDVNPLIGGAGLLSAGVRELGAAIPSETTRGTNPDGSMKTFEQAMADPETGIGREARDFYGEVIKERLAAATTDEERSYWQRAWDAFVAEAAGAGYAAASLGEDPNVIGAGASALNKMTGIGAKTLAGLDKATEAGAHRLIGRDLAPTKGMRKAGFSEENVIKHDLHGKAPEKASELASKKLEDLYHQQKALIQEGKEHGGQVDFQRAIDELDAELEHGPNSELWLNSPKYSREYKQRIARIRDMEKASPEAIQKGMIKDVADAQLVKSDLGEDAAFASKKGHPGVDNDAAVRGQYAAMLYAKVKDQIEEAAPPGLRELNRQMSEIIPIRNAAEHRSQILQRHRVGSLTDFVLGGAAIGEPASALTALAVKKFVDSPSMTKLTVGASRMLKKWRGATTSAEKLRFEKALKKMGLSDETIQAYGQTFDAAGGEAAFAKQDFLVKPPQAMQAPVPVEQPPPPPNAIPFRAKGAPESPAPSQPRRTLPQEADPDEGKIFDQAQTPAGPEDATPTDKAKAHYGVTPHWQKGGYMTPEGEMLNFGNEGREARDLRRDRGHEDVSRFYQGTTSDKARQFFIEEGNIRLHPESGAVEIRAPLTESQKSALTQWWGKAKDKTGTFKVEAGDFSRSYPSSTSPRAILKDIDDALSGKTPKAQSDMQRLRGEADGRTLYQEDTPNTGGAASEAGLPPGRENNPKVIAAAAKAWKEKGTDSPFFKRWFGKSKVVDEAGKPMVVYHGSIKKKIKAFDINKAVEVEGGVFFTTNEDVAGHYTYERAYGDIISDKPLGNVFHSYLQLNNPMEYTPKGKIVDAIEMGRAVKAAKAAGHDGLIVRNIDDSIGMTGDMGDVFVAFDPSQIKSATGNRGTFDPKSKSILDQKALGQGAGPKGQIKIKRHRSEVTYFEGLADASTVAHEFGHELRARHLTEDQNSRLLRIYGAKSWGRAEEETFARNIERYYYDGKAPHESLKGAFAAIKNEMRKTYKDLKGTELEKELHPEVRLIMDAIFIKNIKIKNPDRVHRIVKAIQKGGATARLMTALKNELNEKEEK